MATPSEDLQKVIYDALVADAAVSDVVDVRVFDGRPEGGDFPCVTFGSSDYLLDDMDGIDGREETLQLDCWVRDGGRLRPAKALADKVRAALHEQAFSMPNHALANLQVEAVRAFMDADGLTGHGIVTVTATVEERG